MGAVGTAYSQSTLDGSHWHKSSCTKAQKMFSPCCSQITCKNNICECRSQKKTAIMVVIVFRNQVNSNKKKYSSHLIESISAIFRSLSKFPAYAGIPGLWYGMLLLYNVE